MSPWQLEVSHDRNTYITEVTKFHKSGILTAPASSCTIPSELLYLSNILGGRSKVGIFRRCEVCFGGFPGVSDSKESAYNAGNVGLVLGWGRSPGDGSSNPFQNACLKNPMDRGGWWATVHGVARD